MRIADLDTQLKAIIIAEIGNNHEGDFGRAREMIHAAAEAGADAVKFQTIVPERLVAASQTERIAQLGRFRLSRDQFTRLKQDADDAGVFFLSTPFDTDSARFLNDLVPAFKIASADNTFLPLLAEVAATGKPVLLSTGLCDRGELESSLAFLRLAWSNAEPVSTLADRLALLHCVSAYPTPPEQAGLGAIRELAALGATPGYSDHTLGIEAAVLAVAAGARIIEKHFTLDKNLSDFRDHQISADPADMTELVRRVRDAEAMLGPGEIDCAEAEAVGRTAFRRSIAARTDLATGTVLGPEHLDWVRPGGGLPPGREDLLLGRTLAAAKRAGDMLLAEDVD